jgi:alpha-mannosidase
MLFHTASEERLYLVRAEQALKRLMGRYIADSRPLAAELAVVSERPVFADRPRTGYRPVGEGEAWGRDWETGWFHLTGEIPQEWAGREVQLWIEITGEGLVYRPDGTAIQGITHGSIFDYWAARPFVPITGRASGGEPIEVWLEGAANHIFGITPPGGDHSQSGDVCAADDPGRFGAYPCTVKHLRIAATDPLVWSLGRDLEVVLDLYRGLTEGSVRRARLMSAICSCCESLARDESDLAAARTNLADVLAAPANPGDIPVRAVGHAHIDTAWLWPLEETERKTARTFASQLDLIERYPGYVFGASSAQHYLWMKERHPDIYARIQCAVKAGTWEVQGGMWVEADCNIPSGESLVRQFIHGKNFFRDEFSLDVDNLWLPDVFGYSAALPQIMAKSGVTTFLTQKLSWNQFNPFPHHTFWWEGLDGSRVLTHFPPEDTYNSELKPSGMIAAQARFREKAVVGEVMSLFGVGDGGGGPRPQHLENGLRMRNLEGCPPVRFGRACDFFTELAKAGPHLKSWVGELYFELHRGTFTTQGYVKRLNRRLELRLRELEMLCSAALPGYPAADFDAVWKTLLLHQFHDIIPGSSIHAVYQDTHRNLEGAMQCLDRIQEAFADAHLPRDDSAMAWFNSLPHPWRGVLRLPAGFAGCGAINQDGGILPTQDDAGMTLALVEIPAQGWITLRPHGTVQPATTGGAVLENALVRYVFASDGTITSAFDKRCGREVLRGPGNLLTLYHDRPHAHDAWDVDRFYKDERIANATLRVEPLPAGRTCQRLRLRGTVGVSDITIEVSLAERSARLDFATTVVWREKHRMLRVAFPAAVHASEATCDVQYGSLHRPTHQNTSWDMARFEVCCHRYADISQPDFGLALLNDCKYGYSVHDNVLDLNLLRSPTAPDPDADQGVHTFTYALLPHPGDHLAGNVIMEAALLNQVPVCFPGRAAPDLSLAATVDGAGVDLAVLKRAERAEHAVIRLAETGGRCATATIRLPRPARLVPCDLLEWHDGEAAGPALEHRVELPPFAISTWKIMV